jgi:hypothetical protein
MDAGIAATAALTRQAIALEVLKKSAESQGKIAEMLQQAVENVPAPASRGVNVNISA